MTKDTYYFINKPESGTQPVNREQFDEAVLTNHSFVYLFEAPSFTHYYAYQNEEDYQRAINILKALTEGYSIFDTQHKHKEQKK